MPEVIVPPFPGVTSAIGLVFVDPLDDFSWAWVRRQHEVDLAEMRTLFDDMEDRVVTGLPGRASSAMRSRSNARSTSAMSGSFIR